MTALLAYLPSPVLLPLLVVVAGLPILFLTFRAFDRLVLIQRTRHGQVWEADGCPHPFFFSGNEQWTRSFRSLRATRYCSMAWLFSTPEWCRADPEGSRQLKELRRLAALWNLVVMPIFAVAMFVAVHLDRLR